jgi:[CysO sulfur-carrier protein]-S-L-cysteine hydrolase
VTTAARLALQAGHLKEILEHARRDWPIEACGLLGGSEGKVQRVIPVSNLLRSPVAYEMEPVEQVRAMVEIEQAGWEICGIYHSHPAGPAVPSEADVAQAYYPQSVYVIASHQAGQWTVRGFRIENGTVHEAALEVVE